QAKHGEAEPLFQRAFALREKVLGLEHPAVANYLDLWAQSLRRASRLFTQIVFFSVATLRGESV
ncbi:unnamed protein product, partial [Laminaria digitata]